jgi:hypothetical protein
MERRLRIPPRSQTFAALLRRVSCAVFLTGSLVVLPISAQTSTTLLTPQAQPAQPSWTVDLHPFGFALDQRPSSSVARKRGSYSLSGFDTHGIAFTSTGQIAVIFSTATMNGSNWYVEGTATTHFISIDAATGKVLATTQWDGPGRSSLTSTPSGKFLLDGGQLVLYSSSLQVINSVLLLKQAEGRYVLVSHTVSSDGKYVLVESGDTSPYTLAVYDTETLQPTRSWSSDLRVDAFSEHHLSGWNRGSLYVKEKDTDWRDVYKETDCRERYRSADFLTDNLMAVCACNKLTLVDTDGNVSFSERFPDEYKLEDLFASANGERFAISVAQLKRDPIWLIGDRGYQRIHPTLTVYDSRSHQVLSSFVLNQKYEQPFSCAFSADGSQLALLRSGILELYHIPHAH